MVTFPIKAILTCILLTSSFFFTVPGAECSAAPAMAKNKENNGGLSEATAGYLFKGDLSKIYQLLANGYKDQSVEDINQEQTPSLSLFKRKFDDYGHLRFGRSNSKNQFKYSDPDYGHMRFGK